jgi:hypothetical protein
MIRTYSTQGDFSIIVLQWLNSFVDHNVPPSITDIAARLLQQCLLLARSLVFTWAVPGYLYRPNKLYSTLPTAAYSKVYGSRTNECVLMTSSMD